MNNKSEMQLTDRAIESIGKAARNWESLMAHSVSVSAGIPNTRVTHGKSQGQITVSSLGPATARPLIDEKNVYSLGD